MEENDLNNVINNMVSTDNSYTIGNLNNLSNYCSLSNNIISTGTTTGYYCYDIDDLIERNMININDYSYIKNNEGTVLYSGNYLYINYDFSQNIKIKWIINNKPFEACQEALKRITEMKEKLNGLEKEVYETMLKKDKK